MHLQVSDYNSRNKWNHLLAVVFSFIINFISLLFLKRQWDKLSPEQRRRFIIRLFTWSWALFALMVLVSTFFRDEINAFHESRSREQVSAVIGSALAVVLYLLWAKKGN